VSALRTSVTGALMAALLVPTNAALRPEQWAAAGRDCRRGGCLLLR